MHKIDKHKICRVCGLYYPDFFPWGPDGDSPTFDYCSCCGIEFGYQDSNVAGCHAKRMDWIRKGSPWKEPERRPLNWDMEAQVAQIPEEYR